MNNNFCYIHIPFCTSKCKYCRFASYGNIDNLKIDLYIKNLLSEIENKKTDFSNLKSVYFGGGTPSILSLENLEKIVNKLKEKYIFSEDIEINIEATPSTITKENLIGWKKIGINRLSIGVQTLNEKALIEVGRDKKGDILNALNNIKEIGFNNVSLDFIIGLAYVKKGEIIKNMDFLLSNYDFIKHFSVYMLEEYYEIPEDKESKFDNIVYPKSWNNLGLEDSEYLDEYISIKKYLKEKGYLSYEISNFSKKGFESKHNSAYWSHYNILAFGLGAHGFLDGERYSNSEDFLEYYGNKNIYREKITNEDIFLEKIMFQLRTSGISLDNTLNLDKEKINYFIENGYLKIENNKLILEDNGVLFLDYIIKEII